MGLSINTIYLYLLVGAACTVLATLRYLLMVGIYYGVVYKWKAKELLRYKIEQTFPKSQEVKSEMYWGIVNNINFGIVGMFVFFLYRSDLLSLDFNLVHFSPWYHIFLLVFLLYAHDAYFFWIHYLMHTTKLGKWARHDVHHSAHNVSPWSAFSVHFGEGFLEVAFRAITLAFIPMHPLHFIAFEIITFALNIIGHSGYEFFPKSFATSPLTQHNSCASFHYLHHQDGRTNLSLFFNHWDKWMGTLNPQYKTFYQKIMSQRKADLE